MPTNPYTYTTSADAAMFFGRQAELQRITEGLLASHSFALIGGRRIGKTSLIEALQREFARRQADSRANTLPVVLVINWDKHKINNINDFFVVVIRNLTQALSAQVPLTHTPNPTEEADEAFTRLLPLWDQEVRQHTGRALRVILMLDKCDDLNGNAWVAALYARLRALHNNVQLRNTIKILMSGSLSFLRGEVQQKGSDLENMLEVCKIGVLDEAAARRLITEPLGSTMHEEVVSAVMAQSGRHPVLIQYLMHEFYRLGAVPSLATPLSDNLSSLFTRWRSELGPATLKLYAHLALATEAQTNEQLKRSLRRTGYQVAQAVDALIVYGLAVEVEPHDMPAYMVTGSMFTTWLHTHPTESRPPPLPLPTLPPDNEEIAAQQHLLVTHRRTLTIHLEQQAKLGMYTLPSTAHGIAESRKEIKRIKAVLRGWGVPVTDAPDDMAA